MSRPWRLCMLRLSPNPGALHRSATCWQGLACSRLYGRRGLSLPALPAAKRRILTLAVVPKSRRGGVGRALVRKAATHAQGLGAGALFLEVAKDNEAAQKLYSGLGFKPVGLRKAYFDGKDAQVMRVTLPLPKPALPNPGDFA